MHVQKKSVMLRFYEELNDFLPAEKRKIRFEHFFWGTPSVKDLIESLGVPHTEIDLILVNSKSVGFDYTVKSADDISVYPLFESIDISKVQHLRPEPLRRKKFICDVHLGKLSKLLRFCGFDTLYRKDYTDSEIIGISLDDRRTILTRDTGILKHKNVTHGYYVRSRIPEIQLRETIKRFDLVDKLNPFSRCSLCNGMLIKIDNEKVMNKIPPKVKEFANEFSYCPKCDKVYWKGSHYQKLRKMIEQIRYDQ